MRKELKTAEWLLAEYAKGRRDFHGLVFHWGPHLRGANLSGCDFTEAEFPAADLERANLSGATLHSAYLAGGNLVNTDLSNTSCYRANLSGTDLAGARLFCTNLACASLTRAYLRGTDLRYANVHRALLTRAVWDGLQVGPLPSGPAAVVPTSAGWEIRVGCWRGTLGELETLIAQDDGWPEAEGEEIKRRRPILKAFIALAKTHIEDHPGVIRNLAKRWGSKS